MSGRDGDGHAACCPAGLRDFWAEESWCCMDTGSHCMGGDLKGNLAVKVQGENL